MSADQSVDRLLAAANPVPPETVRPGELDERALAHLASLLRSAPVAARPGTPRATTRRVVLAGGLGVGALAVVGAGAVAVRGRRRLPFQTDGLAATPPLLVFEPLPPADGGPAELLRRIAARVARLPDDTGTGPWARVSAQTWALATRVDGVQVTSVVVPAEVTTWRTAAGDALVRTVRHLPGEGQPRVDELRGSEAGFMWPLGSLAADDATLARQLEQGHPVANGPAERFVAVRDLCGEQVLAPAVRAAVLRYVAATPGLVLRGRVTDRLGRPGVAVSVDSAYSGLPTRYTLVVDDATGRLLDSEELLTTTAGRLNVPVPSVIGYAAFREARFTDRPD